MHENCPVSYINELGGVYGIDHEDAREWRRRVIRHVEDKKKIEEIRDFMIPAKIILGGKEHTMITINTRDHCTHFYDY